MFLARPLYKYFNMYFDSLLILEFLRKHFIFPTFSKMFANIVTSNIT